MELLHHHVKDLGQQLEQRHDVLPSEILSTPSRPQQWILIPLLSVMLFLIFYCNLALLSILMTNLAFFLVYV